MKNKLEFTLKVAELIWVFGVVCVIVPVAICKWLVCEVIPRKIAA